MDQLDQNRQNLVSILGSYPQEGFPEYPLEACLQQRCDPSKLDFLPKKHTVLGYARVSSLFLV